MANVEQKVANQEAKIIKTIEVIATERETKDGLKKFTSYKAVQKNGKMVDCKFREVCGKMPKEDFFMDVDIKNINFAKNTKYPVLWVAKVESFITKSEKLDGALADGDLQALNEAFGNKGGNEI